MAAIWVALGSVLGILFLWTFLAEPLQQLTKKTGALTVSGLFSARFNGSYLCVLPVIALQIAATYDISIAEIIRQASYTLQLNAGTVKQATGGLMILNGLSWAFGYPGNRNCLPG